MSVAPPQHAPIASGGTVSAAREAEIAALLRLACRASGARSAFFCREAGDRILLAGAVGPDDAESAIRSPACQRIFGIQDQAWSAEPADGLIGVALPEGSYGRGAVCMHSVPPGDSPAETRETVRTIACQIARLLELDELTDKVADLRTRAMCADHALNGSEALGNCGSWDWNIDEDLSTWSPNMSVILDVPPLPQCRRAVWFLENCLHPEDRSRVEAALTAAVNDGTPYDVEYRIRRQDGTEHLIHARGEHHPGPPGQPRRMHGWLQDITERKRTEQALRQQTWELQLILDAVPAAVFYRDLDLRLTQVNRAMCDLLHRSPDEIIGHRDDEMGITHAARYQNDDREVLRTGIAKRGIIEPFRDGETQRWFETDKVANRDEHGNIVGLIGFAVEITERKIATEKRKESEERFRLLAENIREVFWISTPGTGRLQYVSPACETVWNRPPASLLAMPDRWLETIHEQDRARVSSSRQTAARTGEYAEEYRILRPDGSIRWVSDHAFPVKRPDGSLERIVGVARDITSERNLEDQCRQSQKLEGIGQLASGVAHDFNNILTVIHGNAAFLAESETLAPELREHTGEILRAAESAGGLTRQLLMFSRKQVMRLLLQDVNEVVENLTKMLQRALGETITLRTRVTPGLPAVRLDSGMIEQVILNLAVNARDAMPGGGRLTISTRLADIPACPDRPETIPGPHICLSVSDTGTGIPEEILEHIWEPFYTTKEAGKGTGLGLATVYGILQQHRGWIEVESPPGQGTTFHVYLPAAAESIARPAVRKASPTMPRGTETILVAEDEHALRSLVVTLLTRCGYQVLEAGSGLAALDVWNANRDRIDLLLTDMVMPEGITGRQLALRLQEDKPGLKVVYTSGYSPELTGDAQTFEEGVTFVAKPYHPLSLATAIRACLDRPAAAPVRQLACASA